MAAKPGPYYPGSVVKGLQDANYPPIQQDDLPADLSAEASGADIAAAVNATGEAVNNILSVLRDLGLCEDEPE